MMIVREILRWVLAIFFVVAGANHFLHPRFYERMVPPILPGARAIVLISGGCEIVAGILLVIPALSLLGAWAIIALLVAVFPANIHMAMHPAQFSKFSPTALWLRLPLQFVLVAWAYWYTRGR